MVNISMSEMRLEGGMRDSVRDLVSHSWIPETIVISNRSVLRQHISMHATSELL
jgi:hypothetical protein